jgi:hypothetical protein
MRSDNSIFQVSDPGRPEYPEPTSVIAEEVSRVMISLT